MGDNEDALTIAVRHVAEARSMVEQHRRRIAKFKAAGTMTFEVNRALVVFEKTLELFEENERLLRKKARRLN